MKKTLLFTLMFAWTLYSQAQEIYYRVKFPITHLPQVALLGIPAEEAYLDADSRLVAEISGTELQRLRQADIPLEILIEDVTRYYVERNTTAALAPDNLQNGSVPIPQDFSLGSMGGFCTLSEMENHLDNMASKYPHLITEKISIGTSHQGRDIYMVKISDHPNTDEAETRVLYTGMHHAREPIGMQQLLFFMYHLLENYENDPYIHQLLDTTELYFIPCINPDGYEFNWQTSPQGGGMWRKNRRENPDYTYGVDLNRNYGYMWGYDDIGSSPNTWSETYRGPAPFSEPETQAIRDFILQKHFPVVLNYHSYSNLLLYPWGYIPDTTPDQRIFSQFAQKLVLDNAYSSGPASLMLYSVNGNSDDWMYADPSKPKIFAYTPEVGGQDDGFWPTIDRIIPLCQEQVSANFLAARFAGRYGEAIDVSPMVISQTDGFVRFNFKRYGLEENVPYTIELQPLSTNVLSTGSPIIFDNPLLFKTYTDSIAFTLDPTIQNGDEFRLALKLSDGYFVHTDTLVKIFGTPEWIYQNDCNSLGGWTTNKWDISTFFYTSAPASLTDSRFGSYGSNANAIIYSSNEIDLSGARAALLTFMARWETQLRYDFVQFFVSADNGSTWKPMPGRYTRPSPNPLVDGQPVYDGNQLAWVKEEINLREFLGKKIKVMFQLRSNDLVNKDGFYFDDFKVGVFHLTTGSNKATDRQQLLIYPNPARSSITLNVPSGYPTSAQVRIFDATGKEVLSELLNPGKSLLNTSNLTPGIYQLKISADGQAPMTSRLVILP